MKVESHINYFRKVDAHAGFDRVDSYNKFVKHYLDKGFKIRKLDTDIDEESDEEEVGVGIHDTRPALEFFDNETCPKSEKYPFKVV